MYIDIKSHISSNLIWYGIVLVFLFHTVQLLRYILYAHKNLKEDFTKLTCNKQAILKSRTEMES